MWSARKAISPSTLRHTIISASPEYRVRLGVTISKRVVAMWRLFVPLQGAGLLEHAVHPSDVEESLFRDLVQIAVGERFEGFDRLVDRDVEAVEAGEDLGHEERLR